MEMVFNDFNKFNKSELDVQVTGNHISPRGIRCRRSWLPVLTGCLFSFAGVWLLFAGFVWFVSAQLTCA